MKITVSLAIVGLVALILGSSAGLSAPTADAEVTGSVAVGCEFLIDGIDGDANDVVAAADAVAACDGLSASDIANLASALGNEDGQLQATDFDDVDLDGNQIQDVRTSAAGAVPDATWPTNHDDEIYVIAFFDDDAPVTFDADAGVSVTINNDGGGYEAADVNAEMCEAEDDLDCDASTPSTVDGDGVVVGSVVDATASDDAEIDVDTFQADDTSRVSTQVINIQGPADEVVLTNLGQNVLQAQESATAATNCENEGDVTDSDQLNDADKTFVRAAVTDNDGDELARIAVLLEVDDTDILRVDSDAGEPGSDPNGNTGISVDAGATGIAAFAVICSGQDAGTGTVTATINGGTVAQEESSVVIEVVGAPADCDLNDDGRVSGQDISIVARDLRRQDGSGDIDGDGKTSLIDLAAVIKAMQSGECGS